MEQIMILANKRLKSALSAQAAYKNKRRIVKSYQFKYCALTSAREIFRFHFPISFEPAE
jgi:hypothetical protein